jgi:hypothetical protein
MIYKKLEGTTSTSFQIAKNGVEFTYDKDGNGGLKIYTPKTNALFELGASDLDAATRPNDIPTAQAIVTYINTAVLDLDLENVQETLNSLGEVIAAIGNDPNFFGNLVEILGTDYVDDGSLYMPTDIPDENNDGSGESGKDGLLDASTIDKTASVSKRLSILEQQKSGKRLSVLRSITQTSDDNANLTKRMFRDNHYMYVYEEVNQNGQTNYIQKKISLAELRKLRPGIYTGADGRDLEDKDYVFTEISGTGGN